MKRIIYSGYTKALAVIVFIAAITMAVLTCVNGIIRCDEEKYFVYGFENDFSKCRDISIALQEPENVFFGALINYYGTDDDKFEQQLNTLNNADNINYYIKWNEKVYTNCSAADASELKNAQFYNYAVYSGDDIMRETNADLRGGFFAENFAEFGKGGTLTIGVNLKQEAVDEMLSLWETQAKLLNEIIEQAFVFALVALLMLIYLVCVCGQNASGDRVSMWIDRIWCEFHIAAAVIATLGALLIFAAVINSYCGGYFPQRLMNKVLPVTAAIAGAVALSAFLAIVRAVKSGRAVEASVILRIVRRCVRILIKIVKAVWRRVCDLKNAVCMIVSRKASAILTGMLFVYTAIIGLCGVLLSENAAALIFAVLLFCAATFMVVYRARDTEEINKGAAAIRGGNTSYKIPTLKCDDLNRTAVNINEIAKGLDASVAAQVRAERMKTELITNVSHDLKTPITSIISYTLLLSEMEALPEEARDYIAVIQKKSERLKTLTQDLFDISKVQSGNEKVVLERLDAAVLINQALGEHDTEIGASQLTFCTDIQKELYISADGRKMSRVIANLIVNILKYSMKGTRVFINACRKADKIVIEMKNISAYPMDFTADEIVGRFVRGDESRTGEGSGLGLAIAKSYTEISGGHFEVVIDGDMFKVIITFDACE